MWPFRTGDMRLCRCSGRLRLRPVTRSLCCCAEAMAVAPNFTALPKKHPNQACGGPRTVCQGHTVLRMEPCLLVWGGSVALVDLNFELTAPPHPFPDTNWGNNGSDDNLWQLPAEYLDAVRVGEIGTLFPFMPHNGALNNTHNHTPPPTGRSCDARAGTALPLHTVSAGARHGHVHGISHVLRRPSG